MSQSPMAARCPCYSHFLSEKDIKAPDSPADSERGSLLMSGRARAHPGGSLKLNMEIETKN